MTFTRTALDAMTDQSLAGVSAGRDAACPEIVELAAKVAAFLAEQFPADLVTAGRAVMCAVQMASTIGSLLGDEEDGAAVLDSVTDVLALAAEQVVREAGTP